MKKIFIVLSFTLIGCVNENVTKDTATQEKIPWEYVTEYKYKGHRYIKFMSSDYQLGYAGVVHDPECECFKQQ